MVSLSLVATSSLPSDNEKVIAEAREKQIPDLNIFIKEIRSGKFLRL